VGSQINADNTGSGAHGTRTWRRQARRERDLLTLVVKVVDVLVEHQATNGLQRELVLRPLLQSRRGVPSAICLQTSLTKQNVHLQLLSGNLNRSVCCQWAHTFVASSGSKSKFSCSAGSRVWIWNFHSG